ncbi:MAG: DUF4294 domain-containing protein [Bacteroidota bacterium]
MKFHLHYICCLLAVILFSASSNSLYAQSNDTTEVYAVVYNNDTIPAKQLDTVTKICRYSEAQLSAKAKWTRLRNAIYVTYPYAKRAGAVMNDVNAHLTHLIDKQDRKAYIKSREKELKKDFTDPLSNLSVYQGKVLMKLIKRETGNNCYEIIKEYKGGVTARLYQTVAFFFGSDLKQPYDKLGEDKEMEQIVLEVGRMYGYKS